MQQWKWRARFIAPPVFWLPTGHACQARVALLALAIDFADQSDVVNQVSVAVDENLKRGR
jgi:hypothetical protein